MDEMEFREKMCEHMERQTDFLGNISRVAGVWETTWRSVRTVLKFFAWVFGLFGLLAGVQQGLVDFSRWIKH